MIVVIPKKKIYEQGEIDGLIYLKKYGEHLLAVKLQQWRQGQKDPHLISEIEELASENNDQLYLK
jgi:hypothetical protein